MTCSSLFLHCVMTTKEIEAQRGSPHRKGFDNPRTPNLTVKETAGLEQHKSGRHIGERTKVQEDVTKGKNPRRTPIKTVKTREGYQGACVGGREHDRYDLKELKEKQRGGTSWGPDLWPKIEPPDVGLPDRYPNRGPRDWRSRGELTSAPTIINFKKKKKPDGFVEYRGDVYRGCVHPYQSATTRQSPRAARLLDRGRTRSYQTARKGSRETGC